MFLGAAISVSKVSGHFKETRAGVSAFAEEFCWWIGSEGNVFGASYLAL
jgi:hypothetical protein